MTPFVLTIRDVWDETAAHRGNIIHLLEDISASTYQLLPPRGAFDYLISQARLFLIFDGLDEVLDSHDRRRVVESVEAFCNLHAIPVLVTSRDVGYSEAPLDPDVFAVSKLADLIHRALRNTPPNGSLSLPPTTTRSLQIRSRPSYERRYSRGHSCESPDA